MHVSKESSPSIVSNPRCDFIEFDNVIEIVIQQPTIGFCVSHSVLDQEQEDVPEEVESNLDVVIPPTFPMHDVHISNINPIACKDSNVLWAKENVLGEYLLSIGEMKDPIIENVDDNHMNDAIKSYSPQTNPEQIHLIPNKSVSLNQSPNHDTPLEDTTTTTRKTPCRGGFYGTSLTNSSIFCLLWGLIAKAGGWKFLGRFFYRCA